MTTNGDLVVLLRRHKADIAPSTARTYASLLRNLYYNATGKDKNDEIDMDWYKDEVAVLDALKDKEAKLRKTILAGLMGLVGSEHSAKYKKQMTADIGEYNEWLKKQEKTETQKNNWKEYGEIKRKVEEYDAKAKAILKKETVDDADRKVLVDWLLLALTTGYYIPPRRSMDYALMKHRGFDRAQDNFIDKNQFVFNKYKTAKTYNQQTLEIPKVFRGMLTKYIRTIPDGVDTLLYDTTRKPLSSVKMAQRLNRLFDAKISVSMLRHIFLTDKLGNIPRLQELEDLAEDMGHSTRMQMEYIKR